MPSEKHHLRLFVEIALIFAIFALQGAWPVPDVNEAHYLGKAIHYWNPDWLHGDYFMESPDTHKVFFFLFGWLSLWVSPLAFVWTLRVATWFFLAWSWRRLSVAVLPRPWYSVLTAAIFACLMERCHMAGEWVIGGAEAKGIAYALVFLGLEFFLRNRWNMALGWFGAASAFHVLVGGWAMVAAGFAWLRLFFTRSKRQWDLGSGNVPSPDLCPRLWSLWPGIVIGCLLALLGIIPGLMLDAGAGPEILKQAHYIYVFERLPHHLVLSGIRADFIVRFVLLVVFWLVLGRMYLSNDQTKRLRAFVTGAGIIALLGAAIHLLFWVSPSLATDLLRYYWFRLADVAIPLGVSLELAVMISQKMQVGIDAPSVQKTVLVTETVQSICDASEPSTRLRDRWRIRRGRVWLTLALVVIAFHLGDHVLDRIESAPPRSFKLRDYSAWLEMCHWIVDSGKIPPGAVFITPRMSQTFKWFTGHSEVAVWKDEPQDARGLVEWRRRIQEIYATNKKPPDPIWHNTPGELTADQLRALGVKYGAEYVVAMVPEIVPEGLLAAKNGAAAVPIPEPPPLPELPEVFRNRSYIVYSLR